MDLFPTEGEASPPAGKADVYVSRGKGDPVQVGGGCHRVTPLYGVCIQVMGDQRTPVSLGEVGCRTDVVYMAVSEDQCRDVFRVQVQIFYVLNEEVWRFSRPRIDHDEFCAAFDDKGGRVRGMGDPGTPDDIDPLSYYSFLFHHGRHPVASLTATRVSQTTAPLQG